MPDVKFKRKSYSQYREWSHTDAKTFEKLGDLVDELIRHPLTGTGKPEKLKGRKNTYSRRIDDANRLVYVVESDTVTIESCMGHYED